MSKINWKTQLEQPQIVKEFSAINCLDLSDHNELLVTSNSRISLYNVNNLTSRKTFNSGGSTQVYGANFRTTDYRLFTSSTREGKLNIYDVNNNKALRTIEGDEKTRHTRAVRRSLFYGVSNIVSFSDDKHIKLWDLAVGSLINEIGFDEQSQQTAHQDYIRCGHSASEHNLVVSGSYDHFVKLWDPRSNSNEPLHKYDHGAQVESVTMKNSLVISAGEKTLKVYDLISGKLVFSLENIHSKSITCVTNYDSYLLTASLDGHVKVFDTNLKMLASLSYTPAPLMSVCVSRRALIVGGNDGLINVRKIAEKRVTDQQSGQVTKRTKTDWSDFIDKSRYENETVIRRDFKRKDTRQCQKLLKEFRYTDVLDQAIRFRDLSVGMELIQELLRRDGLRVAVAGRDENSLRSLVNYIFKHMKKTKYTRVLLELAIVLADVYMPVINQSAGYQASFRKLALMLKTEINLLENLHILKAQMEMIHNVSL